MTGSIKILTDVVVFSSLLDGARETYIADRKEITDQVRDGSSKILGHKEPIRTIVLPLYVGFVDLSSELARNNYTA